MSIAIVHSYVCIKSLSLTLLVFLTLQESLPYFKSVVKNATFHNFTHDAFYVVKISTLSKTFF